MGRSARPSAPASTPVRSSRATRVAGQRLVTGDAVNVAARLEQAAGAQEVLLGDLTYRLVRDYVDVEEVEPLELKGKSEPVPAYRLVGVREGAERPRRLDAPMVGRDARARAPHRRAVR